MSRPELDTIKELEKSAFGLVITKDDSEADHLVISKERVSPLNPTEQRPSSLCTGKAIRRITTAV